MYVSRPGFNAGFMFETSPAGTLGVERSRRSRIPRVGFSRAGYAGADCRTIDPFHRRVFDVIDGAQRATEEWTSATDGFGFEQPDRGLSQRIVVGVADTADRCRNPLQHKRFHQRDRGILTGFNRWKQHPDMWRVFDGSSTASSRSRYSSCDEVAGAPPHQRETERLFWIEIAKGSLPAVAATVGGEV